MSVIVGPMPNNILAGQLASAAPVMANFNWIMNQVNANAVPVTGFSLVLLRWGTGVSLTSNTAYAIGRDWSPAVITDTLTEFNTGTGNFTATQAGVYLFNVYIQLTSAMTGITNAAGVGPIVFTHNASYAGMGMLYASAFGTADIAAHGSCIVPMAIGDQMQTGFFAPAFTGGTLATNCGAVATNASYQIARLY